MAIGVSGKSILSAALVLAVLLGGVESFALQCASLFSSFAKVEARDQDYWSQLRSQVQDPRIGRLFEKLESWSRQNKVVDYSLSLKEISSRDRLAMLLYVVGATHSGREVINKNIRNLDRYFDEASGEIASLVMVRVREMQGVAYFEHTEDGGQLRLNRNLKVGTAAVVLAHELTHAYDYLSSRSFTRISRLSEKVLTTEYNAYLAEKGVIRELLLNPSFKKYFESVREDDINNLFTRDFSAKDFIRIMEVSGISAHQTEAFLRKQSHPNF